MDDKYFATRLAKLREQRNISASKMSLALGQNRNYINQIENGKAHPTMQVFFYICEYLGITPCEFFEPDNKWPGMLGTLIGDLKTLDQSTIELLSALVKKLR